MTEQNKAPYRYGMEFQHKISAIKKIEEFERTPWILNERIYDDKNDKHTKAGSIDVPY